MRTCFKGAETAFDEIEKTIKMFCRKEESTKKKPKNVMRSKIK